MKVPLSWLREYVDVNLALDDLFEVLGRNGLELEGVVTPGAGVSGVITAEVLEVAPHPDADKLSLVRVTDGTNEHRVVCGAHNFAVGDIVPYAGPGAELPGGLKLERREIRGQVSAGMLCSPIELEVADDHGGLMVLPTATPLGIDVHDLYPLGEPVLDIAVMADRGDHLSVLGVARDLGAILDSRAREPEVRAPGGTGPVPVRIEAQDGCRHYVAWAVEGVTVGPSPWWLRRRLEACGVRSINTVVDVTNYVALELGQPLHAFDLDALHGPEVVVRWAADGETLRTLDDRDRRLVSTDLVIADADRGIALAGVMGGADTEVTASTTRVLIEAAVFDPAAVRRTSRRLNLVSEASIRFERRVDPTGAWRAAARAVDLLTDIAGATDLGAADAGNATADDISVALDTGWCAAFLGLLDLTADDQAALLERAGCEVDRGETLTVRPPAWRGDLRRPADLAEEVVRLHGYERVPATLPAASLQGGLDPAQRADRDVRGVALAAGFHESQTRPFVGERALLLTVPTEGRVRLANPLAADASDLRPSLAEGLLQALRHNVGQGRASAALFEVGRVFRPAGDALDDSLAPFGTAWRWADADDRPLPTQPRAIGLVALGPRSGPGWVADDEPWSVFDLLGVLDAIVARLAPTTADGWWLERVQGPRPGLHPGRCAALRLRGSEIGVVGQLHPTEGAARDLPGPVVLAELLLDPLLEHLADGGEPRPAPVLVRHPAMTVDVALVADDTVAYAKIEQAVRRGAGELLDELWWFDEYRGEQLGAGRRSVGIRLRLQSADRQLTDGDAEAVIEAIATAAEREGATLRR